MIQHAQFEQWVPFPPEEVFQFFANPQNLPRIMPPATATRIDALTLVPPPTSVREIDTARLAGVGSKIVTSFRIIPALPLRASWIARITEFEWNRHFADLQEKGPFKSFHHRHDFAEEMSEEITGTRLRDRIEYEIGYGVAGEIIQRLLAGPQMVHIFKHRNRALEDLLSRNLSTA